MAFPNLAPLSPEKRAAILAASQPGRPDIVPCHACGGGETPRAIGRCPVCHGSGTMAHQSPAPGQPT